MSGTVKITALIFLLVAVCAAGLYITLPALQDIEIEETANCLRGDNDREDDQVWIDGGKFIMGESAYYPEEEPIREVKVEGFWIDKYEVTNAQFARFVEETGYVTEAEKRPDPALYPGIPKQDLIPGSVVFFMPADLRRGGDITQWWQFVPGANWREPYGPGSDIHGKEHHPVVHVSYSDARAYAQWVGRQLPTEAEWEYAARGGLEAQPYTWGTELKPADSWQANIWQGTFPLSNSGEDGYQGSAPAGCYPANRFGLHDMAGNVWEWVSDWYYPRHDPVEQTLSRYPKGFDPRQPGIPVRVIKGGSYLCAKNYCLRYRPAARQPQESTLSAAHIGFRTVLRPKDS